MSALRGNMTQATEYRAIGNDGAMLSMLNRHDPFNHHESFTLSQVADMVATVDILDAIHTSGDPFWDDATETEKERYLYLVRSCDRKDLLKLCRVMNVTAHKIKGNDALALFILKTQRHLRKMTAGEGPYCPYCQSARKEWLADPENFDMAAHQKACAIRRGV
jgi:hypothetical protein